MTFYFVRWLEHVRAGLEYDVEDVDLSWAAYHSKQIMENNTEQPVDISALLPLFDEQAKSIAMIKHSMTIVKNITNYLNKPNPCYCM